MTRPLLIFAALFAVAMTTCCCAEDGNQMPTSSAAYNEKNERSTLMTDDKEFFDDIFEDDFKEAKPPAPRCEVKQMAASDNFPYKRKPERIYQGKLATLEQFPYMAKIYADSGRVCGGVLIRKNFVLTAGQCVYGERSWTVHLGTTHPKTRQPSEVVIKTRISLPHPDYEHNNVVNDIALLYFLNDIPINEFVKPIEILPATWQSTLAGNHGFMVGWGKNYSPASCDGQLSYADIMVIPNEECKNHFADDVIDNNHICGIRLGGGTLCPGDTGSAIVVLYHGREYVAGISSFTGNVSCSSLFPCVFTRVNRFTKWLSRSSD